MMIISITVITFLCLAAAGGGGCTQLNGGRSSGSDFLRWLTAPIRSGVRATAASAAIELPRAAAPAAPGTAALRRRGPTDDDLAGLPPARGGCAGTQAVERRRRPGLSGGGCGVWGDPEAAAGAGESGGESVVMTHWML